MTSITDLCNRSLLALGTRSNISSLNEGSTESDACSILFQSTFEQLARTAHWNCLRNQGSLSLLAAAPGTQENPNGTTLPLPPQPWLYSYLKPPDCLFVRYLQPTYPYTTTGVPFTTTNNTVAPVFSPYAQEARFTVAYGTNTLGQPQSIILTNVCAAQAIYTVNVPVPDIWDSLFEQAMVAALAAYLVPALSLNMSMMQMQIKLAEGAIAQARIADGDEGYTSQNRQAAWMVARSDGLYNNSGFGASGLAYGNMAWGV